MPWVNKNGETREEKYRRQYTAREARHNKHKSFSWQLFHNAAPMFAMLQEYAQVIVDECEGE
jgi:hypothetical protein